MLRMGPARDNTEKLRRPETLQPPSRAILPGLVLAVATGCWHQPGWARRSASRAGECAYRCAAHCRCGIGTARGPCRPPTLGHSSGRGLLVEEEMSPSRRFASLRRDGGWRRQRGRSSLPLLVSSRCPSPTMAADPHSTCTLGTWSLRAGPGRGVARRQERVTRTGKRAGTRLYIAYSRPWDSCYKYM